MRLLEAGVAYHVVSRTAFRKFIFNDEGKRKFVDIMRRQAAFAGVELLSFCVMSNHFHLLIRIREDFRPRSDRELIERYRRLYPRNEWISEKTLAPDRLEILLAEGGDQAKSVRSRLISRMGDLSIYVKELKQRFSIWFNRRNDNCGTLWESKFRSQIVENATESLRMVAAYIELNPVRAGLVERAEDYAWSSTGRSGSGKSELVRTANDLRSDRAGKFEASTAGLNWTSSGDARLIRGGCLGSAEFVRKICERLYPGRAARFKPKPMADVLESQYVMRLIG